MSCCCHICKELFLRVLLPVVAVFHFDKQSAVNPFRIWEAQIRNARLDTHLFEFNCLLLVSAASVRYMEQRLHSRMYMSDGLMNIFRLSVIPTSKATVQHGRYVINLHGCVLLM